MSEIGSPTQSMCTIKPVTSEDRANETLCGKAESGNYHQVHKEIHRDAINQPAHDCVPHKKRENCGCCCCDYEVQHNPRELRF